MSKKRITITLDEDTFNVAKEYCNNTGSKLSSLLDRILKCMFEPDSGKHEECRKWVLNRHEDILRNMKFD